LAVLGRFGAFSVNQLRSVLRSSPETEPGASEQETPPDAETGTDPGRKGGRSKRPRGRPTTHGLTAWRKTLAKLGTQRLDQRSAIAVAAKRFKADLVRDLGGDVSRQQETVIELAARTWIIIQSLDQWLMLQPSLVLARKRALIPALVQRQQLADSLTRMLERLGLERVAADAKDLVAALASHDDASDSRSEPPEGDEEP
jgi:hypothetical protein